MAELATGAVTTLLGVIRNESERLGRARADMLFIQEEMESMHSFLAHLQARSHEQEQDAQVRTWMNQVRILATDCNKFLDVYLYKRNRQLHCPGPLSLSFWWLYDMLLQHFAADDLRQLKERARDIGERRLRYGVKLKVPAAAERFTGAEAGAGAGLTVPAEPPSLVLPAASQEDDDDDDDDEGGGDGGEERDQAERNKIAKRTLDDYFNKRIADWMQQRHDAGPEEEAGKPGPEEEDSPQAAAAVPTVTLMLPADTLAAHARNVVQNLQAEALKVFRRPSVTVDIPAVHYDDMPLRPKEILFYIHWELKREDTQHDGNIVYRGIPRWSIYYAKKALLRDIIKKKNIEEVIEGIIKKKKNEEVIKDEDNYNQPPLAMDEEKLVEKIDKAPLDVLLRQLIWSSTANHQDQRKHARTMRTFSEFYNSIIETTAKKLVEEWSKSNQPILLSSDEYQNILKQVFPRTGKGPSSTSTGGTSVEDEIKEMVFMVKEMIQELQEYNKSAEKKMEEAAENKMKEAAENKMKEFGHMVREQLKIKKIMGEIIKDLLKTKDEKILIILKMDAKHISKWEETSNTLSLLRAVAGVVIVTTTTTLKSHPQLELEYSFAGMCLDIMRQDTSEDDHQIVRNILKECGPHEFCRDIFAQALKASPERSSKELRKLHRNLQATPKSRPSSIARKMLKFSYSNLPQGYKTCLLYLAIFGQNHKIRRSTLVGRWVAEGLITTEDWHWSSSVYEANKCFECLIKRQFVRPDDIGATGRVKTCKVDPMVHKFITKIAMKQRIMEARLSPNLAHHFSIFNDVRLRKTETIEDFLKKKIRALPEFSKLTVLDLEGCHCFAGHKSYLKDICKKIRMLKYLSLRGTDVTSLPCEINKLHELEVLDIRGTQIPASATRKLMLLKLKHLLAGHIDPCPRNTDTSTAKNFSSVEIPKSIEKMSDVEILSNVKPHEDHDLKDIGSLSQLKKLGVTINTYSHLKHLLDIIINLLQLRSLSITLNVPIPVGTGQKHETKILDSLESLSISGSTQMESLLSLLVTNDGCKKLAKVTLSGTLLKQDDLKVLAKLGNLQCVRLQQGAYTDSQLTFEKDEFSSLELLLVDSSSINKISFNGGSPKLEKIVLSFTDSKITSFSEGSPESGIILSFTKSSEITNIRETYESPEPKKIVLFGTDKLRGLKELDLVGDISPGLESLDEDLSKYSRGKKFVCKHIKKLENQDQETRNA